MSRYVAALILFCMATAPAHAIIVSYGDFVGSNVMFLDVTEDTRSTPNPLFGPPAIYGDGLDFNPLSFFAKVSTSNGVSESQIVDGQLNFTLMSNSDSIPLSTLRISEAGDYTLVGLLNAQAIASVAAPVRWTITHVDGAPISSPVSGADSLTFSPSLGSYSLQSDAGTGVRWDGDLLIDIRGFAQSNGILGNVTKVEFVLDNTLSVSATDGGSAAIFKKDFGGVQIMAPEPAGMALLAIGFFALLGVSRRNRKPLDDSPFSTRIWA